MNIHDDTRDRVVALERDVKHLSEQVEDMADKVSQMHQLLMQAKGARWAVLTLVAVGGFMAGKIGSLITLFGIK
jgi:phage-related minor tail protein